MNSLGLVLLACRPGMTVGWAEIFILLARVAFLPDPAGLLVGEPKY